PDAVLLRDAIGVGRGRALLEQRRDYEVAGVHAFEVSIRRTGRRRHVEGVGLPPARRCVWHVAGRTVLSERLGEARGSGALARLPGTQIRRGAAPRLVDAIGERLAVVDRALGDVEVRVRILERGAVVHAEQALVHPEIAHLVRDALIDRQAE